MDVNLLQFVVKVLKNKFHIANEQIALRLQYFPSDISLEKCVEFWTKELKIEGCRIQAPTVKEIKSDRNKHLYGICSIRVYDTKLIQMVYGAIKEYANLNEDKWLESKKELK